MNEADTRAQLIDPKLLEAGWGVIEDSKILREYIITIGKIQTGGGRAKPLIADYVLVYKGIKLAVIEAKSNDLEVGEGVGQAKLYADKLQLDSAFATNGREIYSISMNTAVEGLIARFPTPEELWNKTFEIQNLWRDAFNKIPYEDVGGTKNARYYQEIAVNNTMEAVANNQERILLTLATGTGKTFIAFQIAWKLFQSRWNLQSRSLSGASTGSAPVRTTNNILPKSDHELVETVPELVETVPELVETVPELVETVPELVEGAGYLITRRPRILFLADRNILADQAFNAFSAFPEDALVRISPREISKKGSVPVNGSIFFTIFQTFMTGGPAPSTSSGSDSARTGFGVNKLTSDVQKRTQLVDGALIHNKHLSFPPDPEPVEGADTANKHLCYPPDPEPVEGAGTANKHLCYPPDPEPVEGAGTTNKHLCYPPDPEPVEGAGTTNKHLCYPPDPEPVEGAAARQIQSYDFPEVNLNEIPGAYGYMYILSCDDGSFYTGSTKDIILRLKQHQNGEGANHTKKFSPVKLIYYEAFDRIDEAFNREKQIQGWTRAKKIALIKGEIVLLQELASAHSGASTSSAPDSTTDVILSQSDPEPVEGAEINNEQLSFHTDPELAEGTASDQSPQGIYSEYPPDFFDFIIIDECHRGGANDEGNWRGILEYFKPAVQLGLTATPKRKDNIDTYKYFGDPVYVYSLKEGINDGYLTPFKVKRIKTTLDDYIYTSDDQIIEGEIEEGKLYTEPDFNRIIEIKAREAKRVQVYMDEANQSEKAIIFCATQDHAAAVRDLVNQYRYSKANASLNPKMVTEPAEVMYCVRVTANDGALGDQYLKEFQDNEKTIPTILTTSQKLSTGVDARNIRNIVLMRPVNSMIEFKQIIGRGTRLFDGKEFFTIYDFVDAYHHFNDPEWDGEPIPEEPKDYKPGRPTEEPGPQEPPSEPISPRKKAKVKLKDGKEREIQHMVSTSFWSAEGKPISAEEFLKNLYGSLPSFFSSEEELRELWSNPMTRKTLLSKLNDAGYGKEELTTLQRLIDAEKSDLFDVLEYVSFAVKPITREVRVAASQSSIFALLDNKQKEFLEFVLSKYIESGVDELDQEKLPILLQNKYQSLGDAMDILGDPSKISTLFVEFQKFLYKQKIA
jgi:superfamily II DNA or RNA helicase/predicted GIY-YIG superfamily endonuclease